MSNEIFQAQVLENTKPIKEAIEVLNKLSQNFEIYVITARTKKMIEPVKKWLKEYGIHDKIKKIISSSYEKKQDICLKNNIEFLCDDDLRHIIDTKVSVRVLFTDSKIINNNEKIVIAKSWNEIENILNNL